MTKLAAYSAILIALTLMSGCKESSTNKGLGESSDVSVELKGFSVIPVEIKVGETLELIVLNPDKQVVNSESIFSSPDEPAKLRLIKEGKRTFILGLVPGEYPIRAQFNNKKHINGTIKVKSPCLENQHLEEFSCVDNTRACHVDFGVGEQRWTDGIWGDCSVKACNEKYIVYENACVPESCKLSDVEFSTAVIGDRVNGCFATACEENYKLTDGKCDPYFVKDVYLVNPLSNLNIVHNFETNYTGYFVGFIYENKSHRTINGVKTEDLPITVPETFDYVKSIPSTAASSMFMGQPVTSCSKLQQIEPNQRCSVIMELKMGAPIAPAYLDNETSSFKAKFLQSNQEFSHSLTFKRVFTFPNKTVIAEMSQPVDLNSPTQQENGTTKGSSLAKILIGNSLYDYIAPCYVKSDGTKGQPRGVYPFIDRNGKDTFRVIGSKVLFAGRGCSHNGTNLVYKRWTLWEYDLTKITSSTNPRPITRDLSQINPEWPMGSMPNSSMVVLNNKLYFNSATNLNPVLNPNNYERIALFEYDPAQPYVQGTNPREIFTGYEGMSNETWASSYPVNLTSHKDKIYFTGNYFTSNNSALKNLYHGVMEYDPSKPINHGNRGEIELTDNPRFVWGWEDSKYDIWSVSPSHVEAFYVDDEVIVWNGDFPSNPEAPVKGEKDPNGREIAFIRRSDGKVFKHDFCEGSCDGEQTHLEKVGNSFIFSTNVMRSGVKDRSIGIVIREVDESAQPTFSNRHVVDTNPEGNDFANDLWNLRLVRKGDDVYIPMNDSNGTNNIYKFNPTQGITVNPIFTGPFKGISNQTSSSFGAMHLSKDGKIGFRNHSMSTSSSMATSFNIFDTNLAPNAGETPSSLSANHFSKIRGWWPHSWGDDDNYFYVFRAQSCSDGKGNAWYLETVLKNNDYPLWNYTHPFKFKSCASEDRYIGLKVLLIR